MSENTDFLLKLHLSAIVPLMITDIAMSGGIDDWQLERVKGHATYLGEHGDAILYRVKGETGKAMNVLCECLAVLAFVPGGVKFAGLHFEGSPAYEAEDVEELKELQEALSIESEPDPEPEPEERMPTWAEIFATEKIESDAVKLGIPVQRARKRRS